MADVIEKLIIIGSGPAGLTSAIYAARANLQPLIIEGLEPGGQLMGTTAVENWPGEISILGPKLMMNMRQQAEKLGTRFESGEITQVAFDKKPFTITTSRNKTFQAHCIIIATGAQPKKLSIPGEDTYWGKGVTTCAVCDGPFYKDKPVVIVGGGDTAMEDASFMKNYTNNITIVQNLDKLTASHAMQQRVINDPLYKIIYNSTVTEIKGTTNGVTAVSIKNQKTGQSVEIPTNALFLAIGLKPNTEFLKGKVELNQWNYLVLHDTTKTSVEGVFGAGDIHDYRYRQAITAAGAGCMAALDAERYLHTLT